MDRLLLQSTRLPRSTKNKTSREKRGWEQITQMFTGESKQILQNLIDNNTITETDQRTPILALKAIETAIKNKEHHRTSTTTTKANSATTTTSNTQCPWKKFYKQAVKYMKSLHIETCEPQMKIARFMYAMKHNFASTTMDLTKDSKKSTKQLQGSKSVMFKIMAQNPSSSTSYSDTDSAYSTEAEINYTEHLPRPPCISKPTKHTLKNTSSTFSKILKKPADHKVQPGDQTFLHPHSNEEHQQAQSSKHLNTPAKAKHFYTTKHPNYRKATNSTCTKDVYSIYIPAAQKKNTTITNPTSTS